MKIIEPKVELWKQGDDAEAHVARCARVCYGKETGNDKATVKRLIDSNHWSMFRHETYYAAVSIKKDSIIYKVLSNYKNCPYIKYFTYDNICYIITNGNFMMDIKKDSPVLYNNILSCRITEDYAKSIEYIFNHYVRYTFCVDTQISTSRELNRVSPNSIAEKSTRYVYEDGSICRPYWLNKELIKQYEEEPIIDMASTVYLDSCNDSFKRYKFLVENGVHRQDARGVLPLDTATRCVYTYSINELRHILDLRYYGTTGQPHPNARLIAGMIRDELIELGYEFREL